MTATVSDNAETAVHSGTGITQRLGMAAYGDRYDMHTFAIIDRKRLSAAFKMASKIADTVPIDQEGPACDYDRRCAPRRHSEINNVFAIDHADASENIPQDCGAGLVPS